MRPLALPTIVAGTVLLASVSARADPAGAVPGATRGADSGCDAACAGLACGWSGECFCARCGDGRVCDGGRCVADVPRIDPAEPNDTPARARRIAVLGAGRHAVRIEGRIASGRDRDWHALRLDARAGPPTVLTANLSGLAPDRDLDLAVCFRCDRGGPALPDAATMPLQVELDAPIRGARCIASMGPWGRDERVEIVPACRGGGAHEGFRGTAWIVVWPATPRDHGGTYRLDVRMDAGEPGRAGKPESRPAGRNREATPGRTAADPAVPVKAGPSAAGAPGRAPRRGPPGRPSRPFRTARPGAPRRPCSPAHRRPAAPRSPRRARPGRSG